jgi:hypothetical protein
MAMGLYLEGASELARVRLLQERLPGQVESAREKIRAATERLGADPLRLLDMARAEPVGKDGAERTLHGGVKARILAALEAGPLTTAEIRRVTGITREQWQSLHGYYLERGYIVREGEPGAYVYRLPDEAGP